MSARGPSDGELEWFDADREVETEADWLSCPHPPTLLDFLNRRDTASRRKFFLFGAACVRRVWHLLTRPELRAAVEAAEAFADGLLGEPELLAAHEAAEDCWRARRDEVSNPELCAGIAAARLAPDIRGNHGNAELTSYALGNVIDIAGQTAGQTAGPSRDEAWWAGHDAECRVLADLFRCVMGNPFRPVAFAAEWRTPTAVAIARGMYESRDFSAMPVLADALEEAGCPEPTVLGHCRDPKGLHARGCWVVDLVLDREPPPVVE